MTVELSTEIISMAADKLAADPGEITGISAVKMGMTNRSFLFSCRGEKYMIRVPGKGTERLIDRRREAETYALIGKYGISDQVVYISPDSGIKITRYLEGARVCDPGCREDLIQCMGVLRGFHGLKLRVDYQFDLFEKINFYESLWEGRISIYPDYQVVKEKVFSLRGFIEQNAAEKVLAHIDAVPDNFLFYQARGTGRKTADSKEEIRLADWEYAGMQDPHVDLAMFSIYALYGREQIEQLLRIYFEGNCLPAVRAKIYCYIAACGLLWSNWCEYKQGLGEEFGEYAVRQYQYAREYYSSALEEIKQLG